jgi:heptaprenyl diphosphate synthase
MTAGKVAFLSFMLVLMFVLSTLEFLFVPLLPPYVKPGLANIVVMYCVFCVGRVQAVTLNVLKSFFVFVTRGPVAGLLSLCGGLLSIAVIIILVSVLREKKASYFAVSAAGACAHNLGQLAAAAWLLSMPYIFYYLPVLIMSGIAMGLLTGVLLRVVMPIMAKLSR